MVSTCAKFMAWKQSQEGNWTLTSGKSGQEILCYQNF